MHAGQIHCPGCRRARRHAVHTRAAGVHPGGRGRLTRPRVYVDEQAPGYLEHLLTYQPHELHVIESYYGGEVIYAYTTAFVERMARSRRPLAPLPSAGQRAAGYPSMQVGAPRNP